MWVTASGNRAQLLLPAVNLLMRRIAMLLTTLLVFWTGFTAVLIGLLIYRSTLQMHEAGQIFLDRAEDHLAKEQEQLGVRIDRLQPWIRMSGAGSAILIVVIASLEMYSRLAAIQ
jgi:hypothetical protein